MWGCRTPTKNRAYIPIAKARGFTPYLVKEILQEECNVKSAQIERYIANSVKYGLLFRTKYRGVYEINPFMIAKGRWESIRKLRCKFDFIDGKWSREIEESEEE